MKNWTRPEVSELEVSMTASGFFNEECEFWFITNDSEKEKNEEKTQES